MPLSSSEEQNPQPLEGKPPSYAEIFRIGRTDDVPIAAGSLAGDPPAIARSDIVSKADGRRRGDYLHFYKAERSGAIAAYALRLASIADLPLYYSDEDAHRFANYVESNTEKLKAFLPLTSSGRKRVLEDVDQMFGSGLETKRRHVFIRWFRDRATPADLNPCKLIDPKAEKKGSIFQILHPVVFNVGVFVIVLAGTLVTFALFFRAIR